LRKIDMGFKTLTEEMHNYLKNQLNMQIYIQYYKFLFTFFFFKFRTDFITLHNGGR